MIPRQTSQSSSLKLEESGSKLNSNDGESIQESLEEIPNFQFAQYRLMEQKTKSQRGLLVCPPRSQLELSHEQHSYIPTNLLGNDGKLPSPIKSS